MGALSLHQGGVKMHTLLDLRGNIPSFIHISDGKSHDVHALDLLLPESGAIYFMDRGYVDFTRLHVLHRFCFLWQPVCNGFRVSPELVVAAAFTQATAAY
jgi:hypothetical protein